MKNKAAQIALVLMPLLALCAPPKPPSSAKPPPAPAKEKEAELDAMILQLASLDAAVREETAAKLIQKGPAITDKLLAVRKKTPASAAAIDAILEGIWTVPGKRVAETLETLAAWDPRNPESTDRTWKTLTELRGKAVLFLEHVANAPGPRQAAARDALDNFRAVSRGESLFFEKAQCASCHKIGPEGKGTGGPDLAGIGNAAEGKAYQRFLVIGHQMSGADYLVESLLDPDAYVPPGYAKGTHPDLREDLSLSGDQIKSLVAFLQALGGKPDLASIQIPSSENK